MAFAVVALLPLFGIAAKVFGASFQKLAKWYLYISVFCVVVVMDSIFFPFIGGKDWFFRFSVELSLIAALLWWAFEARAGEVGQIAKAAFKRPLVIATTIFSGIVVLASLFAFDAHAGFWSNFERGEGGFQMLHYLIFFFLLTFFFREEKDWKKLFRFSLVAAVLMILYGLLAISGAPGFIGPYAGGGAPAGWWAQLLQGRFEGSLGNPAYVAPYLMFAMFFAAYLWIAKRSGDGEQDGSRGKVRAWSFGILIAIFFLFFWLSQTRGAFLGLGAGVFALLVYLLFSKHRALKKWSAIALLVLVVVGGIGFAARNSSFVNKLPGGRLLQISLSDSTAQTRFWVWGEAWKGFLQRPILGWGPENFTPVFDQYFNPSFYAPGTNGETWFDRAHSVFFDYLVETGILGLLSYLAIFGAFYWEFFKSRRTEGSVAGTLLNGFIFAMPIAYLVQGVAIFDVLPMYLCLFTFLAFSQFYLKANKE
jgi:O-antigen ligase